MPPGFAQQTAGKSGTVLSVLAPRGQHARSIQTKIDVGILFFQMDKKDHPGTPHSHRRWKIPFKNSDPVKHRIAITKNFDNFDFLKTDTTFLFKWFLFLKIHPILFPKNVNRFRPFHIYFFLPSGVGPESSFVPRFGANGALEACHFGLRAFSRSMAMNQRWRDG